MKITFNGLKTGYVCIWYTDLFFNGEDFENFHEELHYISSREIIDTEIQDEEWQDVNEICFVTEGEFISCDVIDIHGTRLDSRMIPKKNIHQIHVAARVPNAPDKNEYTYSELENGK